MGRQTVKDRLQLSAIRKIGRTVPRNIESTLKAYLEAIEIAPSNIDIDVDAWEREFEQLLLELNDLLLEYSISENDAGFLPLLKARIVERREDAERKRHRPIRRRVGLRCDFEETITESAKYHRVREECSVHECECVLSEHLEAIANMLELPANTRQRMVRRHKQ